MKESSPSQEELVISSDFGNLPKVEKFIVKLCKKAGLNSDQSDNMAIALTELVNNAIIHGNKQDIEKKVTVAVVYHSDHVVVAVSDEGVGFNPTDVANPTDPQNLWKQNGRGIFLVRNLIDKVEIVPTDSGTQVVLTEYLEQN